MRISFYSLLPLFTFNLPTAPRLSSEYFYQNPLPAPGKDGRQCFHVDKVFKFDRKNERVHPLFRAKLNVMGALFRIYDEKEFDESLYEFGCEFDDADYEAAKAVGANIFKSVTNASPSQSEVKPPVVESTADVTVSPIRDSFWLGIN